VHQLTEYDRERGISYWTKNYRTSIESDDAAALDRRYEYYDPIHTLPASGQQWWHEHAGADQAAVHAASAESARASREAAAVQAGA
jgi:lysine 2,3-aminomutase